MPGMNTPEWRAYEKALAEEIRRVLVETKGNVTIAASMLQMRMHKLSRMLNNKPSLRKWWFAFKMEKKRVNRNARQRRSNEKRRERERSGY